MAEELFIPQLGQTVEEVTIINWHVKDGEQVEQGQEVLEVETDKAVFDVEATGDGFIHFGPYKVGDVVPVLAVVAMIGEKDEKFEVKAPVDTTSEPSACEEKAAPSDTPSTAADKQSVSKPGEKVFASPRARKLADAKGVDLSAVSATGGDGTRVKEKDVAAYLAQDVKASPIAKKMADEKGIDLRTISGTGTRGEITRADVERAFATKPATAPATAVEIALPKMEIAESTPLRGVRGVIAERMATSAHTTARVTLLMDVDATEFVNLREKLAGKVEKKWGFKPGYNDLLAKACACALRRFPYMNTRLNGSTIEQLAQVNIGIAVDAERGLFVPVLQDVDQKELRTVGTEFRQRVDEVRSSKIAPEHLSSGTFTITNLGMYDVDGFTPVINLPEAAILGVGRISEQAVVVDGEISIRKMMVLSLAFDHRLVDGAPAAKFLQYLKDLIETPNEVTLTK